MQKTPASVRAPESSAPLSISVVTPSDSSMRDAPGNTDEATTLGQDGRCRRTHVRGHEKRMEVATRFIPHSDLDTLHDLCGLGREPTAQLQFGGIMTVLKGIPCAAQGATRIGDGAVGEGAARPL